MAIVTTEKVVAAVVKRCSDRLNFRKAESTVSKHSCTTTYTTRTYPIPTERVKYVSTVGDMIPLGGKCSGSGSLE